MKFAEVNLKGAFIIDIEKHEDPRGFFARTWCVNELREHGLVTDLVQCSISFNHKKGTLRGMHFQVAPFEEVKIIRCTMGGIYDVIVDLRKDSATYRKQFGLELTAENRRMLYIPRGFAHGFITLEDNSEIFYQMSEFYSPAHARGFRWNDPAFNITWPFKPLVIHDRDNSYPDFSEYLLQ